MNLNKIKNRFIILGLPLIGVVLSALFIFLREKSEITSYVTNLYIICSVMLISGAIYITYHDFKNKI